MSKTVLLARVAECERERAAARRNGDWEAAEAYCYELAMLYQKLYLLKNEN